MPSKPPPEPPGQVMSSASMPEDMPEEARDLWDVVVPFACKSGTLQPSDLPLLAEAITSLHLARIYRQAQLDGHDAGTITTLDRNGNEHQVKYLDSQESRRHRTAYLEHLKQAQSMMKELGLTPRSRSALRVAPSNTAAKTFAELLGLGDGSGNGDDGGDGDE